MKGFGGFAAAALFTVGLLSSRPARGQSTTELTGSGAANFPAGAAYNGVPLKSLRFGKGVILPGDGSAAGDFEAILVGTSSGGQPQEISVEGQTRTGSLNADQTVTFSGLGTVNMGDGTPPSTNVPFTVRVSAQAAGGGTLILSLGSTTLPVAETTEGTVTNQTNGQLTVSKKDQSIDFAPLPQKKYGDGPFAVSASTTSQLSPSFMAQGSSSCSVAGTTVTITGAGDCTVTAAQSGDGSYNAAAEVARTFTIAKALASVALSNLDQTYTGTAKQPTATTVPAGLSSVALTYNGSSTAPTAAGSYAVVGKLSNPNYAAADATGTLVIRQVATIDVKPGNSLNTISYSSTSETEIWLAVLTTATFNARQLVDPSTATLGNGDRQTGGTDTPIVRNADGSPKTALSDVNGDGLVDILLYFNKQQMIANGDLTKTSTQLVLLSDLVSPDKRKIRGTDKVTMVQ
jgi:MBG domain-containing protein